MASPEMTAASDPLPVAGIGGHSQPPRAVPYGHDNNFDVLRLAMALLVILSHSFGVVLGSHDDHEPLYRLTGGRVSMGGVAVDVFFVISGFLITASWQRSRSPWSFARKRILRIYPGFLAALVVGGCVVGPVFSGDRGPWLTRPILTGLARSALVLEEPHYPGAFATNPLPLAIDSPVWTIRYEVACYAMVFALGITGALRWRWLVLVTFAAVALGYATDFGIRMPAWVGGPGYVARHWTRLPAFYLAGVVLYLYRDRVPIHGGLASAALAGLAAGLMDPPLLAVALVVCGSYLVIWVAYQRWARLPRFAAHGDYSYGTYLYGFPIQQSIVWWTREAITPLRLFATAAPLAVIAGVASWHLVERPFVRPKAGRAA